MFLSTRIYYSKIEPTSYDEWRDSKDIRLEDLEVKFVKELLSQGKTLRKVLDIGTGTGRIVGIFSSEVTFVGMDYSKRMIYHCMNKHRNRHNSHFIIADMNSPPFQDGAFDCILLVGTFESEKDPVGRVLDLLSLLHVDGRLIFTAWNSVNPLASSINRLKSSEYKRTSFTRSSLSKGIMSRAPYLTCINVSYYVIPRGALKRIMKTIRALPTLAKMMGIVTTLVERVNASLHLGLGSVLCFHISRSKVL